MKIATQIVVDDTAGGTSSRRVVNVGAWEEKPQVAGNRLSCTPSQPVRYPETHFRDCEGGGKGDRGVSEGNSIVQYEMAKLR